MTLTDILTIAFVLLGASVMVMSMLGTQRVLSLLDQHRFSRRWRILLFLMAFFLLGYLATIALVLLEMRDVVIVLTGTVFLFGAIFVNLVVGLGHRTISDLKDTTEEARQATALAREGKRLQSQFLANMSHELRTPLNAIIGFTVIMLAGMSGDLDEDAHHMTKRIHANSKRLLGLINSLLDLAKIESRRVELVEKPFSPREMIDDLSEQMGVLAQEKNLAFKVTLDTRLPAAVLGDRERIEQIITNLLSNAIKFTDTGHVELAVQTSENDTWTITVKDTGIGIAPHAREYIFDPFRQGDGSSQRAYEGTGLGLAITSELVRAMEGSITVEGELGEGSTFVVSLPLVSAPEQVKELATA